MKSRFPNGHSFKATALFSAGGAVTGALLNGAKEALRARKAEGVSVKAVASEAVKGAVVGAGAGAGLGVASQFEFIKGRQTPLQWMHSRNIPIVSRLDALITTTEGGHDSTRGEERPRLTAAEANRHHSEGSDRGQPMSEGELGEIERTAQGPGASGEGAVGKFTEDVDAIRRHISRGDPLPEHLQPQEK